METEPKKGDGLLPYLSFSRLDKYLTCPEKYRLYYIEGLRPQIPAGSLVFGQTIHQALAQLFRAGEDPAAFFEKAWGDLNQRDLKFSHRDSWEKLAGTGRALLEEFLREELPRIGKVHTSEQDFELGITSLDLPLIGVIDLVADIDLKRTLIDWKTSSSAYAEHEVALSDQLTAYQLAVPEAEQAALCVFVKTKEPRIDWYVSRRTGDQLSSSCGRPTSWPERSQPGTSSSDRATGAGGATTCRCALGTKERRGKPSPSFPDSISSQR